MAVYWSHWTNFYHHNAPSPELISHATAQLLDCKGGNLGNSFLLDNATVAELVVPLEHWSLFQQLWPLIAKCGSAWPPHGVVINCICPQPCLQIWPSLKSERTFRSRTINQSRVYHWISQSRFRKETGLIFYYPTRRCRGCCFGTDPCRLVPHYQRPFFLWCQHGSPLKAPKMCITFAGSSERLVDVSM